MDFKINFGPWETIFKGKMYDHEVEIVMNPEKYLLTLIYDIKDGKKVGVLVEGQKALVAKGEMGSFIQTLPKRCVGIIKTNGEKTNKMLFISFNPIYVDFKQEDFERKIDNAIKKSLDNIETIIELGKTSSLILTETSMAPETDYSPILGDPFMARSLLSGLKKTAMEMIDFTKISTRDEGTKIQLGLSKNREIIKEEIKNLCRTTIIGKNNQEINYATYILIENFLLENETAIIFDSENYFDGLGQSSKKESELKEALVDYEPSGFPIKKFKAKENFKIELKNLDFNIFFEQMKIKNSELAKAIITYKGDYSTPKELIEKISEIEGINSFQSIQLERILKIIELNYKNLFEKDDSIVESIKKSAGNLGRATIINIKDLNDEEKIVFVNATLKGLTKEIKDNKNIIVFIPQVNEILKQGKQQLIDNVLALENLGIGFVFGTKKDILELKTNNVTTINIVNKKDVAVSIKNNRNYRVILRPSLSGEPKI